MSLQRPSRPRGYQPEMRTSLKPLTQPHLILVEPDRPDARPPFGAA